MNELEKMYEGMKHFPHFRFDANSRANCGFGCLTSLNTPEAVYEVMPKWFEGSKILFVAEGRIDNREELLHLLEIKGNYTLIPDGDIIYKAYLKWGELCVHKLLGKFSFAAFHQTEQRLFIARDKWDYSSVDYYEDDEVFAFSSSSKGLLALPFVKSQLNELQLARLLAIWDHVDENATLIQGIRRLLPSYSIRVTPNHTKLNKYWDYANIKVVHGLSVEDYIGKLHDTLEKATKARIRSYLPIAATLSGGLDSSTVSVMAATLLEKQKAALRTFTHVPRFPSKISLGASFFGDERPYVEAIVQHAININPTYLSSKHISPLQGVELATRIFNEPFHAAANSYWLVDIYQSVVQYNCGTLLLGDFGNATISWNGLHYGLSNAYIFKHYGLSKLIRSKLLRPIFYGNHKIGTLYKNYKFGKNHWKSYNYLTDAFDDKLGLTKKIQYERYNITPISHFSRPQDHAVNILDLNKNRLALGANAGYELGIEFRDPTGDSRVIESALSIPNEIYIGERDRRVLRLMMKDKLPDVVRLNYKKGKQNADLIARLCAYPKEMNELLDKIEGTAFSDIIEVSKIREEWISMQKNPEKYPIFKAGQILRHLGAYHFWNKLSV